MMRDVGRGVCMSGLRRGPIAQIPAQAGVLVSGAGRGARATRDASECAERDRRIVSRAGHQDSEQGWTSGTSSHPSGNGQ